MTNNENYFQKLLRRSGKTGPIIFFLYAYNLYNKNKILYVGNHIIAEKG